MTRSRETILVFGEARAPRMDARQTLLQQQYGVRLASTMAEAAKAVAAGGVSLVVLTQTDPGGAQPDSERAAQVRDAFALPVICVDPGSNQSIAELVRTALGAHAASHDQIADRTSDQDGESE